MAAPRASQSVILAPTRSAPPTRASQSVVLVVGSTDAPPPPVVCPRASQSVILVVSEIDLPPPTPSDMPTYGNKMIRLVNAAPVRVITYKGK